MNWKQNHRVAGLTMGEIANRLTASISEQLGYGRDIGYAGVPLDAYQAGLYWSEIHVIRKAVEQYIPKKTLGLLGLSVELYTNWPASNYVQARVQLRKGHPLYNPALKTHLQHFTVDLFSMHKARAKTGHETLMVFKELRPAPETNKLTMLSRLTSYPEHSLRYALTSVNKTADRILAYADVIGRDELEQLLRDINCISQKLNTSSVSMQALENLSLEKNQRLQNTVSAVLEERRRIPAGLGPYCEEKANAAE